jgi:UDP-N-acetylmuramyl tripeptide synthase
MLSHMGHHRCDSCGAERPRPDVTADEILIDGIKGSHFAVELGSERLDIRLRLPGLYNVYNGLAAAALALALEVPLDEVEAGLGRFDAAFGRFERIEIEGRRLLMLLIKNPAGANEAVRTVVDGGAPRVALLALNDAIADGRDVSWIWDVDFEPLLDSVETLVVTGDRAEELALRFRYAGVPDERIELVPRAPERALDRAVELTAPGEELVCLPTYTAMLALRRLAAARGLVRPYWERAA